MTEPWYAQPDPVGTTTGERGLRFACTACGNCCTGAPGYVAFTDAEARALARRLGLTVDAFMRTLTHDTPAGRSLVEVETEHGHDCVFLDRQTVPGKAVCSVYEDRPSQCRTWPFWPENLRRKESWARAARGCPGMNTGPLYEPAMIELTVRGRAEPGPGTLGRPGAASRRPAE